MIICTRFFGAIVTAALAAPIGPAGAQTSSKAESPPAPVTVYLQVSDARFDSYLYVKKTISGDNETAGIVASHTLIPEALHHAFATFGVLMSPDLPLSRRQHEMITTLVSVTNRCVY